MYLYEYLIPAVGIILILLLYMRLVSRGVRTSDAREEMVSLPKEENRERSTTRG